LICLETNYSDFDYLGFEDVVAKGEPSGLKQPDSELPDSDAVIWAPLKKLPKF
jgi:hypothetical protein